MCNYANNNGDFENHHVFPSLDQLEGKSTTGDKERRRQNHCPASPTQATPSLHRQHGLWKVVHAGAFSAED